MLRTIIIILLLILSSHTLYAQQPDQRIGELINTEDWFELEKEYPILKDSMQVSFLKVVAEAMIARNFNQKEPFIWSLCWPTTERKNKAYIDSLNHYEVVAGKITKNECMCCWSN